MPPTALIDAYSTRSTALGSRGDLSVRPVTRVARAQAKKHARRGERRALADDYIVGSQHKDDAPRFQAELRDRLASFGLQLAEGKTRLIEFGRYAAQNRRARGLGRPETFEFLGFTHVCGQSRSGRFMVTRIPSRKRMAAELREVRGELKRRRHLPIPVQGKWLASVVRGHQDLWSGAAGT
jgi:hypothetical protein